MKKQSLAYLYTAATIAAWSTVSTAFKLSLRGLSPLGLLLISSLTATLFLGIYRLFVPKEDSLEDNAPLLQNLKLSLLPGLMNPFLYYLVLLFAYDRLRAQEAQVLNYTWAIVLAVMSIVIRKEHFRAKDIVALLISLIGVFIISGKGSLKGFSFEDPLGSGMALASSIIWATYWILSLKDPRRPIDRLFFNFLIGSTFLMILSLVTGLPLAQGGITPTLGSLLAAIYVGIFEMGLTFVLWLKALSLSNSTAKISNLIFVTPFLSLGLISLVLKESIHPATLIGLCLIIVSNLYQKTGRKLKKD